MNEPMYCKIHPNVRTRLRCNKCEQPICSKCAVRTPVGYRCPDCVNAQQRAFYADFGSSHYFIVAAVALPLALLAGWLVPRLGWFALVLGPLSGFGISEAVRRALRRRRGEYTWLVVCGCIVAGVLPTLLISLFSFAGPITGISSRFFSSLMRLLWLIVYLVAAVGTAYARLRRGRRR